MSPSRWEYRVLLGDMFHRIDPERSPEDRATLCRLAVPITVPTLDPTEANQFAPGRVARLNTGKSCRRCEQNLLNRQKTPTEEQDVKAALARARGRRRAARNGGQAASPIQKAKKDTGSTSVRTVSGGLPSLGKD